MRIDAQEHRQRLIEAASHVFASEGPETPLQAVVDAAGCGRGTLYRHFADREELIMAVVEREIDQMIAHIEAHQGDPDLLLDVLTRQSRNASVHFPLLCTIDEARIRQFADRLRPRYDQMLAQVLATAQDQGQIAADFSTRQLHMAIEMLGAARTSKAMPPQEAFAFALDIVLKGILQRS